MLIGACDPMIWRIHVFRAETAQMSWAVGDLLHDAVTAHMDPDDDRAAVRGFLARFLPRWLF